MKMPQVLWHTVHTAPIGGKALAWEVDTSGVVKMSVVYNQRVLLLAGIGLTLVNLLVPCPFFVTKAHHSLMIRSVHYLLILGTMLLICFTVRSTRS